MKKWPVLTAPLLMLTAGIFAQCQAPEAHAESGESPAAFHIQPPASSLEGVTDDPEAFVPAHYATRESRRAFYTSPPIIPHKAGMNDAECRACHANGITLQDRKTPPAPHIQWDNCQQCHVRGLLPDAKGRVPTAADNAFQGLKEPRKGSRDNKYTAPPTMPHRLFNRENCLTCHASDHPRKEQRSPHPDRSQCRQCHVPQENQEFGTKAQESSESQ